MRTETRQDFSQSAKFKGNATGGRGKALPGCVDEDRAAASGNARTRVVVDLDNEIVEIILARKPVGGNVGTHFDRAIVAAVGGVLAPSVGRRNTLHRQRRGWPWMLVGPPPKLPQSKAAARRTAVALALVGLDPATTKCHW